jgi:orotate phosphoribosyltransferase
MERSELASRLKETCSLTGHFVLRSGQVSDVYFDKYMLESDPTLLRAVAEHSAQLVPEGTEILAGLELGGVPLSTALSLVTGLPQVLVRKEAKTYGTAKLAEGPEIAGRQVLVVEDVITTGGQVLLSTEELRSRGALVATVLCVIDRRARGGSGADKLAAASISMRSLFTLDEILGTAGE